MSEVNNAAPSVDDFAVTLELTVKEVNALLNILNQPISAQAVSLVAFIQLIQSQAGPQVLKAQESLTAVTKAQDESKAAS
jgi:hypothetical protein